MTFKPLRLMACLSAHKSTTPYKVALMQLVIILLLFAPSALAQSQFQVLVLDALNGKPQAGVGVNYFCTGLPRVTEPRPGRRKFYRAVTDPKGLALLTNYCDDEEKVELNVNPRKPKEQCGDIAAFAVREIIAEGFISKPNEHSALNGSMMCPVRVSRGLKALPGQITVFIKKPTWWQSHIG